MNMMELTIVQNGALYQMQHRPPKRDRKCLRLWQIAVDKLGQDFAIVGSRVAESLEP
jgi:hypothetical protein